MEHNWAMYYATFMAKYNLIPPKALAAYAYGFEIMISTFFTTIAIWGVSLVMHEPTAWIIFLIAFVPERVVAGGYHAKTAFRCHILAAFLFFTLLVCLRLWKLPVVFAVITSFLLFIVVLWLAPVEAPNKPLSAQKQRLNRKKSILFALFDFGLSLLLIAHIFSWSKFFIIYYLSKWILLFLMLLEYGIRAICVKNSLVRR